MGARLGRRARDAPGAPSAGPAPYERRVRWLRSIQSTLQERRPERAPQLLRLLRQDLGLEGNLLTDILYRNVTFLNLVDPISHDLAHDLQCPKKDHELWKSSDKICRQLVYHFTLHSKRKPHRKTQSSLKNSLQKTLLVGETVDLSGIPLSAHITVPGQSWCRAGGPGPELHGAERDEKLHLLLPSLWTLPRLTQPLLNGCRELPPGNSPRLSSSPCWSGWTWVTMWMCLHFPSPCWLTYEGD